MSKKHQKSHCENCTHYSTCAHADAVMGAIAQVYLEDGNGPIDKILRTLAKECFYYERGLTRQGEKW